MLSPGELLAHKHGLQCSVKLGPKCCHLNTKCFLLLLVIEMIEPQVIHATQ